MNEQQMTRVQEHARFLARKSGVTDYDSVQEIEGECLLACVEVMEKFDGEDIGDGLLVQAATWAFFNGRRSRAKEPEMVSMDEVQGELEDGEEYTLHDTTASPEPGPEEVLVDIETAEQILMYVKNLTTDEYDIITNLYGLNGNEPISQAEMAASMGVSQPTVSRLHNTALAKLRARMGDQV